MPTSTAVQRVPLSPGLIGTDETISAMMQVAMGRYGAGSVKIRNLAIDIIRKANVAEKNQPEEIKAVHEWVMNHLRYVRDPYGIEFITHPETLAFDRTDGDCDDHVILEAALLGAIGIPTRFIVVGFKGNPPSHVYMGAETKSGFIPLDPIMKTKPVGWEAPDPTYKKTYQINSADGLLSLKASAGLTFFISLAIFLFLRHRSRQRSR